MAHCFRRVPVQAEVTASDGKVSGYSNFFAAANAEQGAVVSYSGEDHASCRADTPVRLLPANSRHAANLVDQSFFR